MWASSDHHGVRTLWMGWRGAWDQQTIHVWKMRRQVLHLKRNSHHQAAGAMATMKFKDGIWACSICLTVVPNVTFCLECSRMICRLQVSGWVRWWMKRLAESAWGFPNRWLIWNFVRSAPQWCLSNRHLRRAFMPPWRASSRFFANDAHHSALSNLHEVHEHVSCFWWASQPFLLFWLRPGDSIGIDQEACWIGHWEAWEGAFHMMMRLIYSCQICIKLNDNFLCRDCITMLAQSQFIRLWKNGFLVRWWNFILFSMFTLAASASGSATPSSVMIAWWKWKNGKWHSDCDQGLLNLPSLDMEGSTHQPHCVLWWLLDIDSIQRTVEKMTISNCKICIRVCWEHDRFCGACDSARLLPPWKLKRIQTRTVDEMEEQMAYEKFFEVIESWWEWRPVKFAFDLRIGGFAHHAFLCWKFVKEKSENESFFNLPSLRPPCPSSWRVRILRRDDDLGEQHLKIPHCASEEAWEIEAGEEEKEKENQTWICFWMAAVMNPRPYPTKTSIVICCIFIWFLVHWMFGWFLWKNLPCIHMFLLISIHAICVLDSFFLVSPSWAEARWEWLVVFIFARPARNDSFESLGRSRFLVFPIRFDASSNCIHFLVARNFGAGVDARGCAVVASEECAMSIWCWCSSNRKGSCWWRSSVARIGWLPIPMPQVIHFRGLSQASVVGGFRLISMTRTLKRQRFRPKSSPRHWWMLVLMMSGTGRQRNAPRNQKIPAPDLFSCIICQSVAQHQLQGNSAQEGEIPSEPMQSFGGEAKNPFAKGQVSCWNSWPISFWIRRRRCGFSWGRLTRVILRPSLCWHSETGMEAPRLPISNGCPKKNWLRCMMFLPQRSRSTLGRQSWSRSFLKLQF